MSKLRELREKYHVTYVTYKIPDHEQCWTGDVLDELTHTHQISTHAKKQVVSYKSCFNRGGCIEHDFSLAPRSSPLRIPKYSESKMKELVATVLWEKMQFQSALHKLYEESFDAFFEIATFMDHQETYDLAQVSMKLRRLVFGEKSVAQQLRYVNLKTCEFAQKNTFKVPCSWHMDGERDVMMSGTFAFWYIIGNGCDHRSISNWVNKNWFQPVLNLPEATTIFEKSFHMARNDFVNPHNDSHCCNYCQQFDFDVDFDAEVDFDCNCGFVLAVEMLEYCINRYKFSGIEYSEGRITYR
jgi:hypothetical protein